VDKAVNVDKAVTALASKIEISFARHSGGTPIRHSSESWNDGWWDFNLDAHNRLSFIRQGERRF
jgi:hypothetical protein